MLTMGKCIDADSLLLKLRRYTIPGVDVDGTVTVENAERYFISLIEKEAEAVKHGKWEIEYRSYGYYRGTCSACGRTVARSNKNDIIELPYCHCGAKMDLED